ncbi:laminin subunit alpha-5 [Petromyzon marinus]|uniref:laminin subunit alpha-5 n=1 Tax=Petromyzon marinus TaxID=7757 RepID=UPI003F7187F2
MARSSRATTRGSSSSGSLLLAIPTTTFTTTIIISTTFLALLCFAAPCGGAQLLQQQQHHHQHHHRHQLHRPQHEEEQQQQQRQEVVVVEDAGGHSLHPPYFNLAEGAAISATATCGHEAGGLPREQLYCKLVGGPVAGDPAQTIQGQFCDVCRVDAPEKAHPAKNAIDGTERWWQSPPLSQGLQFNTVNVTLDFGQLYHVAYVLIKFANSPRPDLWVLERSTDFGQSYAPWQYFASSKTDCWELFGAKTLEKIRNDDDVICTTEYSRIVPLEDGEVVISLVNGRPGSTNFSYSEVLRDFTKATNVRLRFLRTNTLLGHLMAKAQRDPTVTRRYYYSIKDISIGGRCVCHGHADSCRARNPHNPYLLRCECQHNTCGQSCETCCPGFHQKPWRPATVDSANECEPCNCHGHSEECEYEAEVERTRGSLNVRGEREGGGRCLNCRHNTDGVNCERCKPGFYRLAGVPPTAQDSCQACDCELEHTLGGCEDRSGYCLCRPNFSGERCQQCARGFLGYPHCWPLRNTSFPTPPPVAQQVAHITVSCECSADGSDACFRSTATGQCPCRRGFTGVTCSACAPGHHGYPRCQECDCSVPGADGAGCDPVSGRCSCRTGFQGPRCELCAAGYHNYPLCQLCQCYQDGCQEDVCNDFGRCMCRPEYGGSHCETCNPGFHSFPQCQECVCEPAGSLETHCGHGGRCACQPNFAGSRCERCADGFYGFPVCMPCDCNLDGSLSAACDQHSGQCACRAGILGHKCEACIPGSYDFPRCEVSSCVPSGSLVSNTVPSEGSCQCREHVTGPECDVCKPLYWNINSYNPSGCEGCHCDGQGTLSGVAECEQLAGQCYCKPNVGTRSCTACEDGYFSLEADNYFGCRGCLCDVGGSLGRGCDSRTGACSCRPHMGGRRCDRPEQHYFLPGMHALRVEVEEGLTLEGRPVRFGFDPNEFSDFSWRGYAQMSCLQTQLVVRVQVELPLLYRVVFRYQSAVPHDVQAVISVTEDFSSDTCWSCQEQSRSVTFGRAASPALVTVPGNGAPATPFVLNPGTWYIVIEVQDVLLDYLVLLPSSYYEAPALQVKVTEPCRHSATLDQANDNCLLYSFLPLDGFASAAAALGFHVDRSGQRVAVQGHTPPHLSPAAVVELGAQHDNLHVALDGLEPGDHALVLEFASEAEASQTPAVTVRHGLGAEPQATVTIQPCDFSFLCRAVAVDARGRVAVFSLASHADVVVSGQGLRRLLLHKIHAVPYKDFSMELVEPLVHCVSTHGTHPSHSARCVDSTFSQPAGSVRSEGGRPAPTGAGQRRPPGGAQGAPPLVHLHGEEVRASVRLVVPAVGRYVFVVHFHQPLHPSFRTDIHLDAGLSWHGQLNASACVNGRGCRGAVEADGWLGLDVTSLHVVATVIVPHGRSLWLEYVLAVPEDSFDPTMLSPEPTDKSADFISLCGGNSFHVDPAASPPFCRDASASLSAFHNGGARPCECHGAGSLGPDCEPLGGQCRCRANVIGRQCTRCATGHYGFPHCRPCECSGRLCDETTGGCICPQRTLLPECTQCEPLSFACHPLVGCEECACAGEGTLNPQPASCDSRTGQCRCKANVSGRQCDQCLPGFFQYPDCLPCNCELAGITQAQCDPFTGQCLCKENVEGGRCERCRAGTFSLSAANPKGCTSCFCFGVTDQCQSSVRRWEPEMEMAGWRLVGGRQGPIFAHLDQHRNRATVRDWEPESPLNEVYWAAPASYLGDKVHWYGATLSYQLSWEGPVEVPNAISHDHRPLLLLSGNGLTLLHMGQERPGPDQTSEGNVQLVEGNFVHSSSGSRGVTREELVLVLAGLQELHVRTLGVPPSYPHVTAALRSHAGSVYDPSSGPASGGPAYVLHVGRVRVEPDAAPVEQCFCPSSYRGESCQECAPGYYRDTRGPYLGRCLPCDCNGHSDQCEHGTGACLRCQHNTQGESCERCQPGHVGNASAGAAQPCQPCPCPLALHSNSFSMGCTDRDGEMKCLCKSGYAGSKCDRCAPGFYGNPTVIGSACRPCDCNGNSDPNMIFEDCHNVTGACGSCVPGTAGPRCQLCAPGFYGDAVVAKNCTACACDACGTQECDVRTGRCHCKPGVTGPRCSSCREGYYGFDGCQGCRACECGGGGGGACDVTTGQCACPPGVEGIACDRCQPGHWDLGPQGCRRCECHTGQCDPSSGRCSCPHGVTGPQCGSCLDPHSLPLPNPHGTVHCQPCDNCVVVLLDDLRRSDAEAEATRLRLRNLTAATFAFTRLHNVNESASSTRAALDQVNGLMVRQRGQLDAMEMNLPGFAQESEALHARANASLTLAKRLEAAVESSRQQAEGLLHGVHRLATHVQDLLRQAAELERSPESGGALPSSDEFQRKMAEATRLLDDMRRRSLHAQDELARQEKHLAEKLLRSVQQEVGVPAGETAAMGAAVTKDLDAYQAKLMELRDVLNQASNASRRASTVNSVGRDALRDNEAKGQQVARLVQEALGVLNAAEQQLLDAYQSLQGLENMRTECEQLAAEVDGALQGLSAWLNERGPTGDLESLVQRAEEHARRMQEAVRNLTRSVATDDTSGFTQKAINASRAYGDIIKALKEAEAASTMALDTAMRVEQDVDTKDFPRKAKASREESENQLINANTAKDQLESVTEQELQGAKERLAATQRKRAEVQAALKAAIDNINMVSRGDVGEVLNRTLQAAGDAQAVAAEVDAAVGPVERQLDEWRAKFGRAPADNAAYSAALTDAKRTMKTLAETIPDILQKLDRLQNRIPSSNIANNISRIQTLIAQARDAAMKVKVSMKFNGTSGVQVRPLQNLQDLKAYSLLSFYIRMGEQQRRRQTEPDSRFVMYLGSKKADKNFLGVTVKNGNIAYVYNLGGEDAELQVEDKRISGEDFTQVRIERIKQHGKLRVTEKQYTSTATGSLSGDFSLLHLDPEDTVFYVGGVPPGFQLPPSLRYPNFIGCIELATINDNAVSLYNFERLINMNTTLSYPCGRGKGFSERNSNTFYFDGSGFISVEDVDRDKKIKPTLAKFDMEIRTSADNALVLYMADGDKFLSLEIQEGLLRLAYDFGYSQGVSIPTLMEKKPVNDGQPHTIQIIHRQAGRMYLRLDRITIAQGATQPGTMVFKRMFIGGVPPGAISERSRTHVTTETGLKGCLLSLKVQDTNLDLQKEQMIGVSAGCSDDVLVSRKAYLAGDGFMSLAVKDPFPVLETGLTFRTMQPSGLLFYYSLQGEILSVALKEGAVVLKTKEDTLRTMSAGYNDGSNHYLFALRNSSSLRLVLDDVDASDSAAPSLRLAGREAQPGRLFVGGVPDAPPTPLGFDNFSGCISDVFIRRPGRDVVVQDLQLLSKVQVSLESCPDEQRPPAALTLAAAPPSSSRSSAQRQRAARLRGSSARHLRPVQDGVPAWPSEGGCAGPRGGPGVGTDDDAGLLFGDGKESRAEFALPTRTLAKLHLSLELKTDASNGLLAYASGGGDDDGQHLAVHLAHGHLHLTAGNTRQRGQRLKLKSPEKLNDGQWHSVEVVVGPEAHGELIVDGTAAKAAPARRKGPELVLRSPLYLGGVASGTGRRDLQGRRRAGLRGCVRGARLNGAPLGEPARRFAVTPCTSAPTTPGVFFSHEGGHVLLDEAVEVASKLDLALEVRPHHPSGQLLHLGRPGAARYLALYLHGGQVTVLANDGVEEFSATVSPTRSLCDGQWHRIAVIKTRSVLHLDVDGDVSSVKGPALGLLTQAQQELHIGGLPPGLPGPWPDNIPRLSACLRGLALNGKARNFAKAASVQGAVRVHGCPEV